MRYVIKGVVLLLIGSGVSFAQIQPPIEKTGSPSNHPAAITPIAPRTPDELAEQKKKAAAEMLELLAELDNAYAAHVSMMERLLGRVPVDVQSEIQRSIDSVQKGRIEINSRRRRIIQSNTFVRTPRVFAERTPNATGPQRSTARVARSLESRQRPKSLSSSERNQADFDTQMQKARDNAAELRQIREKASKARESFKSPTK
ncbi:MAG: hypothetical protein AAF497_26405 [Planctomycetota bacterium]